MEPVFSHSSHRKTAAGGPRQSGIGLVELMIAITLGLVLSASVIQVYLASRSTAGLQDSLGRLQESGRFAMSLMGRDIRMTGFVGCGLLERIALNVVADPPPGGIAFGPATVITGFDELDPDNDFDAVEGSDALTLHRASAASARLDGNMNNAGANIQIDGNPINAVEGDYLLVTDCTSADLFRASSVSSSAGTVTIAHASDVNTSNNLSKPYGPDAEVFGFEAIDYFVRDTGRETDSGAPLHALFMQRRRAGLGGAAPTAVELVEGVEDMRLRYGVDTSGNRSVDAYQSASAVSDWSAVLSVRVELLLIGEDEGVVGPDGGDFAQSLDFAGDTISSDDGRMRQVFANVFALRNRVP